MTDDAPGEGSNTRPSSALPATLDRTALERVLARAAELQAAQVEPSDGMSEAQLIDVGKEVGIPADLVRQALAEERTRVAIPEEHGVIGSWFGGEMASASRIVRGAPAQILQQLDQWMQREESLRSKRRFVDRLTWEARRDLVGSLQTGLNFGRRAYALTAASEVGATVVAIDAGRCIVRLDANLREARRRRVGWSAVVGGGMLASALGLVGVTLAIPEASAVVGGLVGSAWAATGAAATAGMAAAQRRKVARAQLALEQILDRLEHGEGRKANPIAELIDVVTKTVKR